VALTPSGAYELVREGHEVLVETGAGVGSSLRDEEFVAAGARIVRSADDVWSEAELVLKVKEPIEPEYTRMRRGQVLFTYLHLAASRPCTDVILASGTTAIAYETVQGRVTSAARSHVRGGRPDGSPGGCPPPPIRGGG
jgi:alanine dehydrogenase